MLRRPNPSLTATFDSADNAGKLTDTSPSTTYEELKNITITPGQNERILIRDISADIAANSIRAGAGDSVTIFLGWSVEHVGDAAKTAPDGEIGQHTYSGIGTNPDCTDNNFVSKSVSPPGVISRNGTGIIIRYWMKYSGSPAPISYCIISASTTYTLIRKRVHGGV